MPSKSGNKPGVQVKVETDTLIALYTNDTVTAAAKQLGINRNTLYERIEKYDLNEKLQKLKEAAMLELMTGSGKAARNLVDKVDHQDPNISVKASTEVLDRIGATKVNNNRTEQPTQIFNQIQINDRKEFFGE